MREIEIKARVHDSGQTLAALEEANIKLGAPIKQHDVVYELTGEPADSPTKNWLRVRTENDRIVIFTLKRSVTGQLDSIEHEVVVGGEAEITAIIKTLGYELFSDLTKIRRKAHQGDIEICYDELPELGTFIEAERLCDEDADHVAVEHELWRFFERLGITRADQETSGYDVLTKQLEHDG